MENMGSSFVFLIFLTQGVIFTKFFIERSHTAIRKNSFVFRTVNIWNHLSFTTKNSDSMNIFKNSIDRELCHLIYDFDE